MSEIELLTEAEAFLDAELAAVLTALAEFQAKDLDSEWPEC